MREWGGSTLSAPTTPPLPQCRCRGEGAWPRAAASGGGPSLGALLPPRPRHKLPHTSLCTGPPSPHGLRAAGVQIVLTEMRGWWAQTGPKDPAPTTGGGEGEAKEKEIR